MNKKRIQWLAVPIILFHIACLPVHAQSAREIRQNIENVKSLTLPFRFSVIGDSRDGEEVYTNLLRNMMAQKPEFIIHLGDMISSPNPKEWNGFFEISKRIGIPFFPVAGNHDVGPKEYGRELYRKQFDLPGGKSYYSFSAGGILFIILDSEADRSKISGDQWVWLESLLSSSAEEFKLVFLHQPLFPPEGSLKRGKAMDRNAPERDDLHRLFLNKKVKAVFAADDHRYDRRERDSILYLISGGGGAPIYAFENQGGYFHYLRMSAEKKRIRGEVVDTERRIRDKFIIEE